MQKFVFRFALAVALLAPGVVLAQHFEAVDTIPLPDSGRFPAYGAEPPRPTEIYARAGMLYDNNLFRLGSGANTQAILGRNDRSDIVTRVGLGVAHQQRIVGRQSIRLEANADQYDYDRYSVVNHTEYGLLGEWLWEFTNDFAGTAGIERRHRLIDLAQIQRPLKDLIDEDHAFVNGGYLVGPHVRLRAGLDGAKAKHSDAAFSAASVRTTTATGAVEYVTPLGNALGIEGRRTQGNAPIDEPVPLGTTAVLVDNNFTEKEIAGVLTLTAGYSVHAQGRIGRTQREHVQFPARNFSGTTGRLTGDWTPLEKTGFEFSLYKEPRTIVDIAASYVIVKGVTFGPRWSPTEKLSFSALALSEQQDFKGDPLLVLVPGTPERRETLHGVRLGASWEPRRFSAVQLGIDHGTRASNVPLRDYEYTAVMANVRLYF